MPSYLSPGVYVEEVPSAVKPIAGVSTSTAGFIGIVPNALVIPVQAVTDRAIGTGDGTDTTFDLPPSHFPVQTAAGSFHIKVNGNQVNATLANNDTTHIATAPLTAAPANGARVTADYLVINNFSPV